MKKVPVLLVGETWSSVTFHTKGFDTFSSATLGNGARFFLGALSAVADVEHMSGDRASVDFPLSLAELRKYHVVVLSDIGADSLLLHPDTWERGIRVGNRLKLLQRYVSGGGGLAMCGGYLSFQGWYGRGRYAGSPVEEVLPVSMQVGDDRVEVPEGIRPSVRGHHEVVDGIEGRWPHLLGYNRVRAKSAGTVIAQVGDDPLLVVGGFGAGRTLAWASDIGPHWCPASFVKWRGYSQLWQQAIGWLAQRRD